jgi:hypothetical protein
LHTTFKLVSTQDVRNTLKLTLTKSVTLLYRSRSAEAEVLSYVDTHIQTQLG